MTLVLINILFLKSEIQLLNHLTLFATSVSTWTLLCQWMLTYLDSVKRFQLRNIAQIRRFLDEDTCHHIVRALVLSRLDYANYSFLAGTTEINLTKLQRFQNKAVRLIHGINRREHITSYLADLHWLPVRERVNFKICTIIYQCINGSSTPYLQNDIHLYTTTNSVRTLRSATDTTRLKVPFAHRSRGDRAFTN